MQKNCGECKKVYSKECERTLACKIHNRQCFECMRCQQGKNTSNQEICFSCGQTQSAQNSFFCVTCTKFLCKKEIRSVNLSIDLIFLPCGCQELKENIVAFMSNYCATCLRVMSSPNTNSIRQCRICLQKNNKNISTPGENNNKDKQDSLMQTPLKWYERLALKEKEQQKKKILQQQKRKEQQKKKAEQKKKKLQDRETIIKLLNQDIKKVQQQLQISEFTRIQLRKEILKSQRDRQCLICTLPYNLSLQKPMMICMQQHLVCQKCFRQQVVLKTCPLCFQVIAKDKVRVSRQRLRTLQLQSIVLQKYDSKKKRYSALCNNNLQELRYKYEIKDAQIQATPQRSKRRIVWNLPSTNFSQSFGRKIIKQQ